MNPEEVIDSRPPTPLELAQFVKTLREMKKWSQATLAEIAKVTERTVQRVEKGESSSLDTRRALARAFDFEDLDSFEKPWPFPDMEKLRAFKEEIEKTTVTVAITPITKGRLIRTMVEGVHSSAMEELGEISDAAREAFAGMVDYLRDYNDIMEQYSLSQRLDVDRELDSYLRTIADERAAVGAGLRHAKVRFKSDAPGIDPMSWSVVYMIIAPAEDLPTTIYVPKLPSPSR
jgi:transcriptional regulator with XRE-family HTH domain